jgi:hypothetical protein
MSAPILRFMAHNVFPAAYRVVVKARAESRTARDFVWEIVRSDDGRTIDRSIRAFKTMEEAYSSGAAALERHSKRT